MFVCFVCFDFGSSDLPSFWTVPFVQFEAWPLWDPMGLGSSHGSGHKKFPQAGDRNKACSNDCMIDLPIYKPWLTIINDI